MLQVYQAILGWYPAEYQAIFAREMTETFEQAATAARGQGVAAFARYAVQELMGLFRGLSMEWIAKWSAPDGYMTSCHPSQRELDAPGGVAEIQARLKLVLGRMEFAIAHHDFPRARLYCDEELKIREQLQRIG